MNKAVVAILGVITVWIGVKHYEYTNQKKNVKEAGVVETDDKGVILNNPKPAGVANELSNSGLLQMHIDNFIGSNIVKTPDEIKTSNIGELIKNNIIKGSGLTLIRGGKW